MKFEQITNEAFGAQNAGYKIDLTAERQIDEAALANVKWSRSESYANSLIDGLYDLDGDLYRGTDGEYYAVAFDYGETPAVPVCWHRLVKDGESK